MEEKIKAIRNMVMVLDDDLDDVIEQLKSCDKTDKFSSMNLQKAHFEGIRVGFVLALQELERVSE